MADDSTTESEYFDDGDDDYDERGGDDALGGAQTAPSAAAAVVVKPESPLSAPPTARAASAADVKPQLREPPPQQQPEPQTAAGGTAHAALKATLPLRAGGLKAPVQPQRVPHTYGYQAPPPVDYAPPLYPSDGAAVSAGARVSARKVAAAAPAAGGAKVPPSAVAGGAPSRSSSSQQVQVATCSACRAVLTETPDLKSGWDCRCCGVRYPTQQFAAQDGQNRGSCRRCLACYKVWRAKQHAPSAATEQRSSTISSAQLPSLKLSSNPFLPAPAAAPRSALTSTPAPAPATPAPTTPAPAPAPRPAQPPKRSAVVTTTVAPALVPGANRCKSCEHTMFRVAATVPEEQIIACRCCKLRLSRKKCFSKSQQREGKQKCMACLGHAIVDPAGFAYVSKQFATPAQPTARTQPRGLVVQTRQMRLELNPAVVSAEREVAKYHNARRALLRKYQSNDLRGSTRVEYEKQLEKEDAVLKELEKKLRAKHPALFDTQTGIKVVPPTLPRDERDKPLRPTRKAAVKGVKGMQAEIKGLKPKKVTAAKNTLSVEAIAAKKKEYAAASAATAVMRSVDRELELAALSLARETRPPSAVVMTKRRGIAAVPSAPVKPTRLKLAAKREAPGPPSASTASPVSVIEDDVKPPAKKRRVAQTKEVDPWLAAQQDIAQGLAKLLGGNLDSSLSASGARRRGESPSVDASSKPKAKSKSARVDSSTYVPKTKLQAETPPRPTIVTRTRRHTSQPVEIIEID